ncbi:hypothetical protein, partial [Burkholderia sp. SIMBA_062]|uniref:hypothetical protein n=1 Tax=Burkholderia sp. SIMBA_062 TaxID=3085803 RepID=UPI00397DECE1
RRAIHAGAWITCCSTASPTKMRTGSKHACTEGVAFERDRFAVHHVIELLSAVLAEFMCHGVHPRRLRQCIAGSTAFEERQHKIVQRALAWNTKSAGTAFS